MNKKTASAKKVTTSLVASSIEVVIEEPKGSRNKFKYDPLTHRFKLSKVLPEGMVFPHDFGFVPSTKGADGDPIDILVLGDEPTFPGCSLECRLIGILEAEQKTMDQKKKRNDRLIAVAVQSLIYAEIRHLRDLNKTVLSKLKLSSSIIKKFAMSDSLFCPWRTRTGFRNLKEGFLLREVPLKFLTIGYDADRGSTVNSRHLRIGFPFAPDRQMRFHARRVHSRLNGSAVGFF